MGLGSTSRPDPKRGEDKRFFDRHVLGSISTL